MDIGRVFIITAFILLFLGIVVISAYGEDYFTAMRYNEGGKAWTFNSEPVVCIAKPTNMTLIYEHASKHDLIKSVKDWEVKSNAYTNTTNFPITVILPQTMEQVKACNVYISIVPKIGVPDPVTHATVIGQTACEEKSTGKQICIIMISEFGIKHAMVDNLPGSIKHEMGHALGLSHRYFDDVYDMARIVIDNDVMFYANGWFRWITDSDLRALYTIYGSDGWAGDNNDIGKLVISGNNTVGWGGDDIHKYCRVVTHNPVTNSTTEGIKLCPRNA